MVVGRFDPPQGGNSAEAGVQHAVDRVMVRTGKAYGNLMVDVRPTNAKLVDRARRIVAAATGAEHRRGYQRTRRRGQ